MYHFTFVALFPVSVCPQGFCLPFPLAESISSSFSLVCISLVWISSRSSSFCTDKTLPHHCAQTVYIAFSENCTIFDPEKASTLLSELETEAFLTMGCRLCQNSKFQKECHISKCLLLTKLSIYK